MKRFYYLIILVMLAFVTAIPTQGATQSKDGLVLEISTTKTEFVQFEPIPLYISLTNYSSKPIVGYRTIAFRGSLSVFTIHNKVVKEIENLNAASKATDVYTTTIDPGEQMRNTELMANGIGMIFPEPGHYQLQAKMPTVEPNGGYGQLSSNLIDIYIRKPNTLETKAVNFINSIGHPELFFLGAGFEGEDPIIKLEEFLKQFTNTPYGDYVAFTLGQIYFYKHGEAMDSSKQDYQRALELFKPLASKQQFILADEALFYVVGASYKLGNSADTNLYFDTLQRLYPNSQYVGKAEKFIRSQKKITN